MTCQGPEAEKQRNEVVNFRGGRIFTPGEAVNENIEAVNEKCEVVNVNFEKNSVWIFYFFR